MELPSPSAFSDIDSDSSAVREGPDFFDTVQSSSALLHGPHGEAHIASIDSTQQRCEDDARSAADMETKDGSHAKPQLRFRHYLEIDIDIDTDTDTGLIH